MEKVKPYEVLCMLGKYNLSDNHEDGSVSSVVRNIAIHPNWNLESWQYDSDIAIVTLFDTIEFTDTIRPVCLPQPNYQEFSDVGTVVGWGKSENSGDSFDSTPSKVLIPSVNASHCLSTYPQLAAHSSNAAFCGGYQNKRKAPCLGDSGGGFYLQEASSQFWNIRGIVSGSLADAEHGCDINKFQLYTNVARFVDWIEIEKQKTEKFFWKDVVFDCKSLEDSSNK